MEIDALDEASETYDQDLVDLEEELAGSEDDASVQAEIDSLETELAELNTSLAELDQVSVDNLNTLLRGKELSQAVMDLLMAKLEL